ncbi:GNAT family N-acetyltransferase [Macellibacteroides fermentans]|uniref:GNAT family N-acetyltransferase n=1 Tax=Macellibacteroides fermentans TaxID=879969 RepID=UPI00406CF7DC
MNSRDIKLRKAKISDYKTTVELTREAFWNHYVPGCDEHYLLHIIRDADSFINELDIVAEIDGKIVGNIVYTKGKLVTDDGTCHEVVSFGPLAVLPEYQGKGIGGMLIEHTKAMAKELGYKAILIYGDPDYYSRFGFTAAEKFKIGTADNMYAAALLAIELLPGALSYISGRFVDDAIYNIDEAAAKEFDKAFEQKELMDNLSTQKRFLQLLEMKTPRYELF